MIAQIQSNMLIESNKMKGINKELGFHSDETAEIKLPGS